MDAIVYGVQRLSENEAHEREKMALRLQLALKDTEKHLLPSGGAMAQTEIAELRARVAALEKELQEHKMRIIALETAV